MKIVDKKPQFNKVLIQTVAIEILFIFIEQLYDSMRHASLHKFD